MALDLPQAFVSPPREFSVMPFWFLNDRLDRDTLSRQLDDFQAHGVHGVVIHPRVGLPRDLGWMSSGLLEFYDFVIEQAESRGMYILLYDEGMYPSGSSSGQVARENPAFATQGLLQIPFNADQSAPRLAPDQTLITTLTHPVTGQRFAVVQAPSQSKIRGLHYVEPGEEHLPDSGPGRGEPAEDEPPASDILNPDAVDCFIRLVYQKFADRYRRHFGKTILGIFTDEPSALAREAPREFRPGSKQALARASAKLGYDFAPHLLSLWHDDVPDAALHRQRYQQAIYDLIEETYYARLFRWCEQNRIELAGHPPLSEDIGPLRQFHIPGQDLVWRYVVPGPKATEGGHATMGKCSSSAMIHLGRRRNSNELLGAYGHNLTYFEMLWLTNWCLIRGVNLLYPHAFYYSVRGPRRDERPPDVGPNSPWWDRYLPYAQGAARLCWLNTDSKHVCRVAILCEPNKLPWAAAKVLQEHQIDFNYLETRHLTQDAEVSSDGIRIRGMHYHAAIIDAGTPGPGYLPKQLATLAQGGRLIHHSPAAGESYPGAVVTTTADDLVSKVRELVGGVAPLPEMDPDIRMRHVQKDGADWVMFFNEGTTPRPFALEIPTIREGQWIHPFALSAQASIRPPSVLEPGEVVVLRFWVAGE